MNRIAPRPLRIGLALAGAAVLALVAGPAVAATPADEHDQGVTVSVPSATPTPTPTTQPTDRPTNRPPAPVPNQNPGQPPAASDGGTNGSAVPSGSSASRGTGSAPRAADTDAGDAPTAPATEPAISGTPATTAEEAKADAVTYPAGGRVTVTAEGFTPGEQVQVVVYSEPVLIGNVPARDDGTFEHAFGLPSEIAPGTHTVQLTGWQSQRVAQVKVVVTGEPLTAGQAPALPDIPAWLWWVLGGIAAVLVLVGGWWIVRVMRAPEAEAVPA